MHILFLTDNFPPEVNAPASRTFEHAREWVKCGCNVTVITCVPNFPYGVPYSGYKNKLWQVEKIDNIRVIRVWTFMAANEGFIKRLIDFLSFAFTSFIASLFVRNVDVVVGTSPQFFTTVSAWLVSIFKRVPFIFELRDLWPESIRAVNAMSNSWILNVFETLELFLYREASAIITVTSSFKKNLVRRGIKEKKIYKITNGVDLSKFAPRSKDIALVNELKCENKFIVGYLGTHGLAHALEAVIYAAEYLESEKGIDDIHFLFVGDGATKKALTDKSEVLKLKNVTFVNSVSRDEITRYWSILDVSIVHLRKADLFKTVIPSKIFECIAMHIPILHCVEGESANIIEESGVGILVEPENSKQMANQILALKDNPLLLEDMVKKCAKTKKRFDRIILAREMLDIIKSTLEEYKSGKVRKN